MLSRMRARSRWAWIAIGIAGVTGVLIGRTIYALAAVPNMAALLAVFPLLLFVGIVAILVLIGLALMAFGKRDSGAIVALIAVSMGLGAYLAGLYGEGIQIVSERDARIEVTLGAPIDESYTGRGTCFTVPNGDVIRRIEGDPFIAVGSTRLSISVVLDDEGGLPQHRVALVPDEPTERMARYLSGIVSDVEVDADVDRTTGSMTFTDLQADPQRQLLGGPDGPGHLDGSVSWTCND
jgi:hypothetical protein